MWTPCGEVRPSGDALYEAMAAALRTAPIHAIRAQCQLTPGVPVAPMLAKPSKSIAEVLKRVGGRRMTAEYKYDGERIQLHRLPDGSMRIFSRNQEDTTQRWPELAAAEFWTERALAPQDDGMRAATFVLDAEVVAWDPGTKRPQPFQTLSTRKRKAANAASNTVRVIVQGFDLLYLNGVSLLRKPLEVRRAALRSTFREVEGRFEPVAPGRGL